jgi:hypothetical protein
MQLIATAQTTLVLGCAAVGIAVVALFAVLRQIRLAKNTQRSRQEAIAVVRRTAPRVVAEVHAEDEDNIPFRMLYVSNKGGGTAYNITVSGMIPDHRNASYKTVSTAEHVIQVLAVNEARYVFGLTFPSRSYARNVRVRYLDVFGNKYITEYRSINEGQLSPIFREPWLGKDHGFAPPEKSSAEVSWPIENYERHEAFVDELVENPDR